MLVGLLVIILIGYESTNRRFAESLQRALIRSYNFFVDLRDLHTVSLGHTLILSGAVSMTLAGLLSSIMYHYRTDRFADYIITYLCTMDYVKEQFIRATWHPFAGILALTCLFFIAGALLALVMKFLALFIKAQVSWIHIYSVFVWGAAPIIFLSPLAMSLFKIMENPSYVVPSLVLISLFLLWTFLRLLKGVSVMCDLSPVKTYISGILACIILLGGLFLYYDSVLCFEFLSKIYRPSRTEPWVMYLSKLEIFGFKSFAQKVNLSFDQGLTAIVGPNGCGKTNVVDAIRWALGEQKPTTLRSDKMEDVIFNGTKSRKPLNIAEVSITIENTKGILPSDYSEVTITRRVFRSGESEYYLNKTLCRLKDIRDLFMDTGMGSDAYSVIELKMVESILSDNSDERRRLFEESAGVTKYKYRRKEAFRRLDVVRQDLTRVNDIIRGVEKAVNSLERQAQKAEKYNDLVKQLQTLDLDLLIRDFSSVVLKIEPLTQQLSVAVDEKNRLEVEVKQEEALLDVLRQESEELERQLTATQEDLITRQTAIHELEQHRATSEERKRSLQENIERFNREKIELSQQQGELEQKQSDLTHSLEQLQTKITAAEEVYHLKKTQLDEFEIQLNAKRAELKTNQEQVISLMHELAVLRNRENQVKARIENIRGRVSYTTEENTGLSARYREKFRI